MYLNFCDFRLCSNIRSDAICTDGYEVTNLITDPEKGFLAYSTIKPPVHIEITFECSVRISHILIWPSVGSQKSTGFILSTKTSNNCYEQYTPIANAMLTPHNKGVLFYPRCTEPDTISTPPNFAKHIMRGRSRPRLSTSIMSARVLRITITKTENSVPALRKVEVWGRVSPVCGPDVLEKVTTLLNALPSHDKHQSVLPAPENIIEKQQENQSDQSIKEQFEIPEDFLDPITWQIMTQPVLLPSGNVIDQSTLEKFEQNENIWGRSVSDPFTGIPFDKVNPILMPVLKSRIDKFLLENSDKDEIKQMPRVLGHSNTSITTRRLRVIPKCLQNNKHVKKTVKRATSNACIQEIDNNNESQQTKRFCHRLPAVVTRQSPLKQSNFIVTERSRAQSLPKNVSDNLLDDSSNELLLNDEVKLTAENVDSIATSEKCNCCEDCILYRLPCRHVICRKQLLSAIYKQCKLCGLSYKSNEVERIHTYM